MRSLTAEDARQRCTQPSVGLAVDEHNFLYYDVEDEHTFFIKNPAEHRRMVSLTYDILTACRLDSLEYVIIWLYDSQLGSPEMIKPGLKILEDIRRANGDQNSLGLAPAEYFRHDEFVELHAYLLQVMAWGWPACFVPSGGHFFVELRSSERAFFYSNDPGLLDRLSSELARWEPMREDPAASRSLAIARYEGAKKRISEGDSPGAIEQFRSALAADPEFYDAAHGLISALQKAGNLDEAISIAQRLVEFSPEDDVAHEELAVLYKCKAALERGDKPLASPNS